MYVFVVCIDWQRERKTTTGYIQRKKQKNTRSYLFIEFTTPACGISIDRDKKKKKKQQNDDDDDESLSLDRTCYYLWKLTDSFLFGGMMREKEETARDGSAKESWAIV